MHPISWLSLRWRSLPPSSMLQQVPTKKIKGIFMFALVIICLVWFLSSTGLKKRVVARESQSATGVGGLSQDYRDYLQEYVENNAEGLLSMMATADISIATSRLGFNEKSNNSEDDPNRILFLPRAPKHVPPAILVHLDFKGAPPKMSYLEELLPLLSRMGATGLLIEYEDMFPYWGRLTGLSAHNAYTYDQVRRLLAVAAQYNLEVIPLVQTFGHMEFVLKSQEFKSLREVSSYPQVICPSKADSKALLWEMIDQTMALHPNVRYLHLGCDEVFHLGQCQDCSRRLANVSRSELPHNPKSYLFLDHVREVAHYVRDNYPGVQPIVWDDMFRGISAEYIVRSRLHRGLVEPMVWAYSTEIEPYITPEIMAKYGDVFPNIWAAGAFKGAFGETISLPDVYKHALNTARWLTLMRRHNFQSPGKFRGLVLTGWQRYDHFSVLCELLPASVPSLAVTILTAASGRLDDDVLNNASVHLGCPENHSPEAFTLRSLMDDPTLVRHLGMCAFPGSQLFLILRTLRTIKWQVAKHLRKMTVEDGWFTLYNVRRNYSNPYRVFEASKKTTMFLRSVGNIRKHAVAVLKSFFDESTSDEWIEQHVDPMIASLQLVESRVQPILARDVWPRRPLR